MLVRFDQSTPVAIASGGNRWSNVKKVMSRIVAAVDSAQPGTCIVVDVPNA